MQVNADLRTCTLDATELPNGWSKDWPMAFPFYIHPLPTGMLGGILTGFSHQQGSSAGTLASHEIQLYSRTYQAVFNYKLQ